MQNSHCDNKPISFCIGHSTNTRFRHMASSGGIGTGVTRYLLSCSEFQTGLTFYFDVHTCKYVPRLIYKSEDFNICGSVYQDINIYKFIKENINNIKNGIVVSCPPCQVDSIKKLLEKEHIKCFIISFCCSGQTTIDGTWKYYELIGVKKEDVANIQYRGNGWPSGIQILLKDGEKIFHDNWTEPWTTLHSSDFYKPLRCLYCKYDTSYTSDLSLADPWLEEFLSKDKIGNTLFLINTELAKSVVEKMSEKGLLQYTKVEYNTYYRAQQINVEKTNKIRNKHGYLKTKIKLMNTQWYRSFFTKDLSRMKCHIRLQQRIYDFSSMNNFKNLIMRVYMKFTNVIHIGKSGNMGGI